MTNWLRGTTPARRTLLTVEGMEDRTVPASLSAAGLFDPVSLARPAATTDVYTETNDPNPGRNAVLGFHRAADGSLTQFGKFATGGTGQLNVPKTVGPDDGDQQVQATPDGKFLYAVNQGSGSVSAFEVKPNGRLNLVGTFPTGGVQPDSVGVVGDRLYVANRGDASSAGPAPRPPASPGSTSAGTARSARSPTRRCRSRSARS